MIRLTSIAVPGFDANSRILDFDMDGAGRRVALLRKGADRVLATDAGALPLPVDAASRVGMCRLLADGRVLVRPVADITDDAMDSCAVVAAGRFEVAPLGVPRRVFTAGTWIFVTYSERTLVFLREPSFEGDIVSVFDSVGRRLFGLFDVLTRRRDEPDAYEVTSGCATADGDFSFVAFGSGCVWTLNATNRTCHAVEPEVAFEDSDDVEALTVDGADAVLMFTREDGLELAWINRRTGSCSRRERLPVEALARHMEAPLAAKPAGGWTLAAEARGLAGGQFIVRTPSRVLRLQTS